MNEQTFVKLVESILAKNVLIKDCGASKEDLMRYKEVKPIFSDCNGNVGSGRFRRRQKPFVWLA